MSELDTATVDPPRANRVPPLPSANGELRDRVQKLRLGAGGAKGSRGGGVTWLPWILCLALALTWAGVAMRTYRNAPKEGEVGGVVAAGPSAGGTASGGSSKSAPAGTVQLVVKGYVIPSRQITVSPIDVGGKVIELNVVEGQLYKEGDTLAVLDPASYKAAVAEAMAAVAGAEQRLAAADSRRDAESPESVRKIELRQVSEELKEAKANEQRAKRDYDRFLGIRDPNSVAGREVQQAEGDYKAAAARVQRLEATLDILIAGPRPERMKALEADVLAAKADVTAAKARLTNAEWRLGNCTIKAPITGTVLTKKAELGNLVNPMAFSGGGGVCDMADLSDPEIDLKIAERDISKLKVGQKCRIVPDAFQDREYEGQIDRIMPIANRADNTINLRVKVKLPAGETPGTYLKPDMGAVVTFLADVAKPRKED
jgi:multidrug resistance efflux pump